MVDMNNRLSGGEIHSVPDYAFMILFCGPTAVGIILEVTRLINSRWRRKKVGVIGMNHILVDSEKHSKHVDDKALTSPVSL